MTVERGEVEVARTADARLILLILYERVLFPISHFIFAVFTQIIIIPNVIFPAYAWPP